MCYCFDKVLLDILPIHGSLSGLAVAYAQHASVRLLFPGVIYKGSLP